MILRIFYMFGPAQTFFCIYLKFIDETVEILPIYNA